MRVNILRVISLLIVLAVIIKAVPPVNTLSRMYFPEIILNWLAEEPIFIPSEEVTDGDEPVSE